MRNKDVIMSMLTCTAILASTLYIGGTVIQQAIFRSACEGVSKKELPKVFTTMMASDDVEWLPTEWDDTKTYYSPSSYSYYSYYSSYYSFAASANNNTQPSVWNATDLASQDDINTYLGGTKKTHHAVCKKNKDGQEPISTTPSAFYTEAELADRGVVDYMEDEPPKDEDVLIDYPEEEPRCTDASLAPIYFFSGGTTSNYEQCNKKLNLLQLMFPGTSAQVKILEGNKSRYWEKTWMGGVLGVVLPVLAVWSYTRNAAGYYDDDLQTYDALEGGEAAGSQCAPT